MKYLIISLSLLLFTSQVFSKKMVPTGRHLVRFVCQDYIDSDSEFNRVLILEQTSSKTLNAGASSETIEGSVLIDPDSGIYLTDAAPFRMRIYNNASLISSDKTEKQIIEELLVSEAGLDFFGNRPMDYTGRGGRLDGLFSFQSTGPYVFVKGIEIFLREKEGYDKQRIRFNQSWRFDFTRGWTL